MTIFLLMGFVPYVGFIYIGDLNLTTMALPITVITIHKGQKGALFGLLMFASISLIRNLYLPEGKTLLSNLGLIEFILILFLGRILIFIPLSFYLLITKNIKINEYLNGFMITLIISIFNTIFVLLFFSFFASYEFSSFIKLFIILGFTNILPEWLIIPLLGAFFAKISLKFKK